MYKTTQDSQDSRGRVGSHATKLHPARGDISSVGPNHEIKTRRDKLKDRHALLRAEKEEVDTRLSRQRLELKAAVVHAREKRKFIPAAQYHKMEVSVKSLSLQSQSIQNEMGLVAAEIKEIERAESQTHDRRFIDCARQVLPESLYKEIWRQVIAGTDQ
jgi:hypothetical protein